MPKHEDKPQGLDQAWLDDTLLRVTQLSRQLATGQPCTHRQYRLMSLAAQNFAASLAHAAEVGDEQE